MKRVDEVAVSAEDRRMLVDFAVEDFAWICSSDNAWTEFDRLERRFPDLEFIHYEVDGADVAIKNRTWLHCSEGSRRVAMGRACADGEANPTQEIIALAQDDGVDLAAGLFIVGPELPDISSSRARAALRAGDAAALRGMLHPRVLAWLLSVGPYRPHEPLQA